MTAKISLSPGDRLTVEILRPAHQGNGIAVTDDGIVILVRGGLVGDTVYCHIDSVKKNFAQARILDVVVSSPARVAPRCPAAAKGAGCCDFTHVDPAAELDIKIDILRDQLVRIGKLAPADLCEITAVNLSGPTGWRTRVRLGVDDKGRAGMRRAQSTEVVCQPCTQAVDGLLDGIVGPGAGRFSPGAELIVVIDSDGRRHVVESTKPARGRRVTSHRRVLEGDGRVTQRLGELEWTISPTDFWQAHVDAPVTFARVVVEELARALRPRAAEMSAADSLVGWDLYGGVGVLAPAVGDALDEAAECAHSTAAVSVVSVENAAAASRAGARALRDMPVTFVTSAVESAVAGLPRPTAVVADPPRTGATQQVVSAIAAAGPWAVAHIGCDPATFARDVASWYSCGYQLTTVTAVNAFPGTSHLETIGILTPVTPV